MSEAGLARRLLMERMPTPTFPLVGLASTYEGRRWFSFWQENAPVGSIFHIDLGHGADVGPGSVAVTMTMPRISVDARHSLDSLAMSALMARGDLLQEDGLVEPADYDQIGAWQRLAQTVAEPQGPWRPDVLDVDGRSVPTRYHTEQHNGAAYRVEVLELPGVYAAVYSRAFDLTAAGGLTWVELQSYV